jgi:hypothetical protein
VNATPQLSLNRAAAFARLLRSDPANTAVIGVFMLAAAFYLWLAADKSALSLQGASASPYNQLADAFLHGHLWVARAPAGLADLPEPYNPEQHFRFIAAYPDFAFYGKYLYLTWGPAPVLVLLVPLHLLGFEPSESLILVPFAIAGLGFALATLHVLLRQLGVESTWMCVLAALTISLCSAVPYLAGDPTVYHEAIAGGFCFAMAGVWLAVSTIADRRASPVRLALMSLSFGLAIGSRPTLVVLAVLLVPVYLALRSTRRRRGLLAALIAPLATCVLLLAAYNQARFGNPLEYGNRYQLSGGYNLIYHWGALGYIPPGVWSYLLTPPRLDVLFPFLVFIAPQVSYPAALPAHYVPITEGTAGLLPMAPIAVFLVALPWLWRRRPAVLGALGPALLALTLAGAAIMLLLSYEFFGTTERYEVDYIPPLLFGALAAWLALSVHARGHWRRLTRVGGGLLVAWGCLAGVAIACAELPEGTSDELIKLGSPVSIAIAAATGHPVLANVEAPHVTGYSSESYASTGSNVTGIWLAPGEHAVLTVVSSSARMLSLVGKVSVEPSQSTAKPLAVSVSGPGHERNDYWLSSGEQVEIPLHPQTGINRFELASLAATAPKTTAPPLLVLTGLRLAES